MASRMASGMASGASSGLAHTTLASLSPHAALLANLQPSSSSSSTAPIPPRRNNGREPQEPRTPGLTTGSLAHAHGSAVVRTGNTTATCAVRAEVLLVSNIPTHRPRPPSGALLESPEERRNADAAELMHYDLIVPNIELATGSAPQFLPGAPPTTLAQGLSTRLYRLLHSTRLVDIEDLRIWRPVQGVAEEPRRGHGRRAEHGSGAEAREVVAYWILYVDVTFVSFDGNAFDVAWAAAIAALLNTRVPVAQWDADRELVLCPHAEPPRPLNVTGLPIACTAALFTESATESAAAAAAAGPAGKGPFWLLVDPDAEEERLCSEKLIVVLDCSSPGVKGKSRIGAAESRVLSVENIGGTHPAEEIVGEVIRAAVERWSEWATILGLW